MSPAPQLPPENDPKEGLKPWVIAGALGAAAAAWMLVELIERIF